MQTIWKYPLEVLNTQIISMPHGAEVLTAQTQRGVDGFALWAKVVPDNNTERVEVTAVGTGHDIPGNIGQYLATVQYPNSHIGPLVFHLFIRYLDR